MTEAGRLGRFGVWRSASQVTPELAGAIPYLVPPEHTRRARAVLGPGPLLAPEHKVVLDTEGADPLPSYRALAPALGLS